MLMKMMKLDLTKLSIMMSKYLIIIIILRKRRNVLSIFMCRLSLSLAKSTYNGVIRQNIQLILFKGCRLNYIKTDLKIALSISFDLTLFIYSFGKKNENKIEQEARVCVFCWFVIYICIYFILILSQYLNIFFSNNNVCLLSFLFTS